MGGFYPTIMFVLLSMFLICPGASVKNLHSNFTQSFKFAAEIDNGKIMETAEVTVEFIHAMETIVEVLPENDLATISRSILKSSGIIGKFDEVGKKLDALTKKLTEQFNETSNHISKATQEIKAHIDDMSFNENVQFLVNQLMNHITMFYTHKTSHLKNELNKTCLMHSVESIFINMKSLLENGVIKNQLKFDEYSDAGFERVETLYKNMMKQLLVAFPIYQSLVNGTSTDEKINDEHIVQFVIEIEEKLKEENEKRQQILRSIQTSKDKFENLKKRVYNYKMLPHKGYEVETVYGKAKCGEHFGILVTRVAWAYAKLFTQEMGSICGWSYTVERNDYWLARKRCWTASGAQQVAQEWKELLENGEYQKVLKYK